jgi:site-specific recombinase XerD
VITYYSALRAFFSWCVETEKIAASPVARVKPPKKGKRVPKSMSREDCEKLIAVTEESKTPERDRMALLLGLTMGLRLSEITNLALASFEPSLDAPEHLRVLGKGDKERVVPVTPAVVEALEEYLPVREARLERLECRADTLFLARNPKNGRLDVGAETLTDVFERLMREAGLKEPGRRAHATRHSFATHLLAAGGDILSVSELMGHASVATTQIYLSVSPERLASVIQANPLAATRSQRPRT